MTTLNLAEAVDRLERRYTVARERLRTVIDGLLGDALSLVPLGAAEAWRAAEVRAGHYHRTRCPLSLADAVLIATGAGRRIASSDRYVLEVAVKQGIPIVVLPDSRGRRASVPD